MNATNGRIRIMASLIAWAASFSSCFAQGGGEFSVPILVEHSFVATRDKKPLLDFDGMREERKHPVFGSGFLLASTAGLGPDGVMLVTARHVIARSTFSATLIDPCSPRAPTVFILDAKEPENMKKARVLSEADGWKIVPRVRIRVGGLSIKPMRILLPDDPDLDVALLQISNQDAQLLGLKPLTPQQKPVAWHDRVITVGNPALPRQGGAAGTVQAEASAATVTQQHTVDGVKEKSLNCTPLNGNETRGGMSGGPLLSEDDKRVVGVVTGSNKETTVAVPIAQVEALARDFLTKSKPYSE